MESEESAIGNWILGNASSSVYGGREGNSEPISVNEEELSQVKATRESEASGNGYSGENFEKCTTTVDKSKAFAGICRSLSTDEMMSFIQAELQRRQGETRKHHHTETTATKEQFRLSRLEEHSSGRAAEKNVLDERNKLQLTDKENLAFNDQTLSNTKESSSEIGYMVPEDETNKTKDRIVSFLSFDAINLANTEENNSLLNSAIQSENKKKQERMNIESFRRKQELLQKLIVNDSTLDVAFLVDCTNSMTPYINTIKIGIEKVVKKIKEMFDNKIRVGFVGYRDYGDLRKKILCLQFTENIDEFKKTIGKISASGGGDLAEDVVGGLEVAIYTLRWSHKNKVLFHIADAPHHGARFHDLGLEADDHYFDKKSRKDPVENLIKDIRRLKILYLFSKINDTTDKMIEEFNRVAGSKIVKYVDIASPELLGEILLRASEDLIKSTIWASMRDFENISEEDRGTRFLSLPIPVRFIISNQTRFMVFLFVQLRSYLELIS